MLGKVDQYLAAQRYQRRAGAAIIAGQPDAPHQQCLIGIFGKTVVVKATGIIGLGHEKQSSCRVERDVCLLGAV